MPTSDRSQCHAYACTLKKVAGIVGIALSTGIGLLWLNQQAIERYWQQTQHAPSPFSDISFSLWQAGSRLEETLETHIQQLEQWLMPAQDMAAEAPLVNDDAVDDDDNTDSYLLPDEHVVSSSTPDMLSMDEINGQPAPNGRPLDMNPPQKTPAPSHNADVTPALATPTPSPIEETARPAPATLNVNSEREQSLTLTSQDRVLFIGDSMMQGVAPHVMKTLLKQYHVQSTNLSLQSTGLTYPKAYDWPGTLRSTLSGASDVKILVVFLGPNDPWDMPSRARGPYLKFKSPAWEAEYRSRIRNILEQAKEHGIGVIWIGPPAMKRAALSEGVRFLDTLYQSEVEAAGQTYIAVDDLFGYQDHRYTEPVSLNGRSVKLRSDDGTHFTVTGQKLISRAVLALLQPAPVTSAPTETSNAPTAQPLPAAPSPRAAEHVFSEPTASRTTPDRSVDAAKVFAPRH